MADNNPHSHPEEVLVSKKLVAASPLDAKTLTDTLVNRDLIPVIERYHGYSVFVQEDSTIYVLKDAGDLTNTGWTKASGALGGFLGTFDRLNPPANPPKDNDNIFITNDHYIVIEAGDWNFTTGDTSPDAGGQHVETLVLGDTISYPTSGIWTVVPNTDLVQSVNGKIGDVILKALDIDIDAIAGITGTQTQEALEELKIITDGLSTGAIYKGAFDPATPPANPPTDGDDVNYSQGDFYRVSVGGIWNFPLGDQTVDGNEVTLVVNDTIRYNQGSTWDVFNDNVNLPGGADESVQYNNNGIFGGSTDFKHEYVAALASSITLSIGASGATLAGTAFGAFLHLSTAISIDDSDRSFINNQNGLVLGANTINANSLYELVSTTKGFLMPRMTTTQKNTLGGLLGTGDKGMQVDDITLNAPFRWDGTAWVEIGSGGGGAPSFDTQIINHSGDGALNIDFSAGVFAKVNLTANITSLTFTATDGKGQVLFIQDVVGGRTVSFVGLKSIDGAIPDYSVNADAESLVEVTIANSSVYVEGAGNMQTIA